MILKKNNIDVYLVVVLVLFLAFYGVAMIMYGDAYYLGDITQMDDNDDVKYVRSALKLNETGTLFYQDSDINTNVPTVFIMPGYPVLLAFFFKVFGLELGLVMIRLVQGLLQIGIMLLVYRMGKRYFHVWTARLAVTLYALYIPNIAGSLMILTEAVFAFLFVLLMYLCFEAVETKKMRYYVGGGIVLGLAVMIRPTVVLFPAVIFVVWLLKKYKVREMLKYALVVGCILAAVMAPWWIRNALVFDRFIPLTQAAGDPFMQGAFVGYDMSDMGRYMEDFPPDTDAFATDQAKMEIGMKRLQESWQADPLATIGWYTVGKTICLWGIPFYFCANPYFESAIQQKIFQAPFEMVVAYHWLLLIAAILGMVVLFRKSEPGKRLKMLLPVSMIYMCAVYLPYYTQPRYAYPLMPLVALLAAAGFYWLWRRLRGPISDWIRHPMRRRGESSEVGKG